MPLNMSSSTYFWDDADKTGRMSEAWMLNGRRIPYWFADETSTRMMAGAGGILSSSNDMVRTTSVCQSLNLTHS